MGCSAWSVSMAMVEGEEEEEENEEDIGLNPRKTLVVGIASLENGCLMEGERREKDKRFEERERPSKVLPVPPMVTSSSRFDCRCGEWA